jgi:hypothetical protein
MHMRAAIGFVIVLWALSQFFTSAMMEANSTATKVLKAVGDSAEVASVKIKEIK